MNWQNSQATKWTNNPSNIIKDRARTSIFAQSKNCGARESHC
jgi:hypothetical protein